MVAKVFGYVIAGFTAITCAGLISLDSIDRLQSDRNIIQTADGAVRLGKVYKERLMTEYSVRKADDGTVLLATTTRTPELYDSALSKLKDTVDGINKDGGIKGDDGKKSKLEYNQASWNTDVIIKTKTYIQYEAERASLYMLTIDENEKTIKSGTSTLKVMNDLVSYQATMSGEFKKAKKFISE